MNRQLTSLTRTIAEGSTWLTGATIVTKFLGIATTLLTLASLSVFEFGTTRLVLSALGIFSFFWLPGLSEIVVADMGIEKGKGRLASARNLLNQFFIYNVVCGILAFLSMFFGAQLIAVHLHNEYVTKLLQILSFTFLIGPLRSTAYVLWRVQYDFGAQSFHKTVEAGVKFALTFYMLTVLKMNVIGYITVYVLTDLVAIVLFVHMVIRSYRHLGGTSEVERLSLWGILLGHGKWVLAQGYVHNLVQTARLWIIKAVLGTEAVGLFSAAYGIFQHVVGVMPLKQVLASIIPQHDPRSDMFRKLIVKGVKYNIAMAIVLSVGATVGVPMLVRVLLPDYVSAIPLFAVLLLGMIPGAASGVFTVVFFALRKQRSMFWVNVWLAGVTCVTLPVLLYVFGIYGVGVELLLVSVIFTWERYRHMCHVLPDMSLPWRVFFTFDEFDRRILRRVTDHVPFLRGVV
ncbi:MAG: oligosaccharide flippase family protein [Candidatus Pacebacteria bacterium]|nr:oligosaccharide flippase family protein [Candidatus Paceibacterota bacterium]